MPDSRYTSYCGLCCLDCIPSDSEFFELIDGFEDKLDELQFGQYALLKYQKHGTLGDYPEFMKALDQIRSLECKATCRMGGGNPECLVRKCAVDKGYDGCWACDGRVGCELLDDLREFHPNLDYHLDLIAESGMHRWLDKRKAHYRWQV